MLSTSVYSVQKRLSRQFFHKIEKKISIKILANLCLKEAWKRRPLEGQEALMLSLQVLPERDQSMEIHIFLESENRLRG